MKKTSKTFDTNAHIQNISYQIDTNNGISTAVISFDNLGYGDITAVKFTAVGYNSFGDIINVNDKETFFIIVQDVLIAKNETAYGLKAKLPSNEIRTLDLEECQICFADGSVVSYEGKCEIEAEMEEYTTSNGAEGCQLRALQDKFGEKYKYKLVELENGWICSCGRFNKNVDTVCSNCTNSKSEIVQFNDIEKVNRLVEDYKQAETKKAEEAKIENERLAKEKKKRNIYIGIATIISIIFICLIGRAAVMSGRSTFATEADMKKAIQGTYTQYKDGKARHTISIKGDTLTSKYVNLPGGGQDLDIDSYNPKSGTFEASFAHCVVKKNGDIVFDGDLHKRGGSYSSSSSGYVGYSSGSSYENGSSVLKINISSVTNNSSYTVCTGTVKNTGKKTYRYVEVKGSFKDSSNNVVDTDWTYAAGSEGLAPGESSSFRLSVPKNVSIKSCSVSLLDYE